LFENGVSPAIKAGEGLWRVLLSAGLLGGRRLGVGLGLFLEQISHRRRPFG